MGVEPKRLSPYHQVKGSAPPTMIFHGKGDTTVPYKTVELFEKQMKAVGNPCVLIGFEGAKHGFFNKSRGEKNYQSTLKHATRFLQRLGYIAKRAPKTNSEK